MKMKKQNKFNTYLKFTNVRYSTISSELVQLSKDMDFIYENVKNSILYNMSHKELCNLQQILLSGFYTFSPLKVRRIRREYFTEFLLATLPDYPGLTFYPCGRDSSYYTVVYPSKTEDVLVFMALSIHLYRLTYGSVPKDNYRILDRLDLFYRDIQNMGKVMGKVKRLYRIDMDTSLQLIPDCVVLDAVKSLVGANSVCYKLVSSFLNLESFDENGIKICFGCMPTVGELTMVLFNLALMEFDRLFSQEYPGIAFVRFIGMVFIACTDDLSIDEYIVWDIIQDIGLSCTIDYTEPEDPEMFEYRNRFVGLDPSGKIFVEKTR